MKTHPLDLLMALTSPTPLKDPRAAVLAQLRGFLAQAQAELARLTAQPTPPLMWVVRSPGGITIDYEMRSPGGISIDYEMSDDGRASRPIPSRSHNAARFTYEDALRLARSTFDGSGKACEPMLVTDALELDIKAFHGMLAELSPPAH